MPRKWARDWVEAIRAQDYESDRVIFVELLGEAYPNAAAAAGDYDHIAVATSLINELKGAFSQMLSHPKVWSGVGDSGLEKPERAEEPCWLAS